MLKIGKLKLTKPYILAPMAGITDLPFRMLNRSFGCELAFVEMLNARSLSHNSRKTKHMLSTCPGDRPLGVQLLGCEPDFILKGMDVLSKYKYDILDFNAACPAKKVIRRGEGASLLKDPGKLSKILKLVVKNAKTSVTVKVRAGWDKDSAPVKDIVLAVQDAGVDALFIHGRYKAQEYSGQPDYKLIAQAKKVLNIPLIASGDIFSGPLAKKMFDETGCDAVAVARGSLGNPWIFKEIDSYLKNGKLPVRPNPAKVLLTATKHLDMCIDFYGEQVGIVIFRKFFAWYTKGFRNIRPLREACSRIKTRQEVVSLFEQLKKR